MDRYSINARIYPILIFILPLVVISVVFSFHFETFIQIGISIGITSALAFLFAQLGRDNGKRKEKKLWKSWGGAPTTQLLRWSNNDLDFHTRKRYHKALFELCPVERSPNKEVEQMNPEYSESVYDSWTRFLIASTRDTAKFPMIYKENINYGFRRNLWGMKVSAIILIVLLMLGLFVYHILQFPCAPFPSTFLICEALLLGFLLFWLIIVRRSWIRIPALAYAYRLLEAIETIKNN